MKQHILLKIREFYPNAIFEYCYQDGDLYRTELKIPNGKFLWVQLWQALAYKGSNEVWYTEDISVAKCLEDNFKYFFGEINILIPGNRVNDTKYYI